MNLFLTIIYRYIINQLKYRRKKMNDSGNKELIETEQKNIKKGVLKPASNFFAGNSEQNK